MKQIIKRTLIIVMFLLLASAALAWRWLPGGPLDLGLGLGIGGGHIVVSPATSFTNTRSVQAKSLISGLFTTVGANVNRLQAITSSGYVTPYKIGAYRPLNAAPSKNSIVATGASDGNVYLIEYNDNVTLLATTSNFAGYTPGDIVTAFWETTYGGQTIWLLWLGQGDNSKVFRSLNQGASWTQVQDLAGVGVAADSLSIAVNGGTIVWGEYTSDPGNNAHVYLSNDGGATWDNIYQEMDYTCHFHMLAITQENPTEIYCTVGDTTAREFKLSLSGGTWTKTSTTEMNSRYFDSINPIGEKVLVSGFAGVGKIDLVTFKEEVQFNIPGSTYNNTSYYYTFSSGSDVSIRHLLYDNVSGVIYGFGYNYNSGGHGASADPLQGIYISSDLGVTWTCIYRSETIFGFRDGYILGDRVYIEAKEADSSYSCYRIPKVSANAGKALRLDPADINYIANNKNVTFTDGGNPSIGDWVKYSAELGPATLEAVAGGTDDSGHCLHIVSNITDDPTGRNIFTSSSFSAFLSALPAAESYYKIKFRVKSANFPANYTLACYIGGSTGSYETLCTRPGPDWTEIVRTGKLAAGDNIGNQSIWIRCDKATGDIAPAFDVYFDDFQIQFSSVPPDSKNWNILAGLPGVGESYYVVYNKTGPWTLSWNWQGPATHENNSGCIATVFDKSGLNPLQVRWNETDSKYELTDGSTTVQSSVTYRRLHNDQTRFYLINDGSSVVLKIVDPVNGLQTITGTGLVFPDSISRTYFGESGYDANYLPGLFWGIKMYLWPLSDSYINSDIGVAGSVFP